MPGDAGRDVASRPHDATSEIELANEDEQQLRALAGLDSRSWTILNDLRWPGRSFPNVDFVAVGPGGVFVIDSLSETGVTRIRNDRLRIDDRPQDGRVLATATAARTVAEWLPTEYRDRVRPIVCLQRRERFAGTSRGVTVCSTANLKTTVTAPEAWLEPQHVEHVAELIRKRLAAAPEPRPTDEVAEAPPGESGPPAEPRPALALPQQRKPPPGSEAKLQRPPAAEVRRQPPSPARQNRHLVWLVLAISLVMLGLLLAIDSSRWLDLF